MTTISGVSSASNAIPVRDLAAELSEGLLADNAKNAVSRLRKESLKNVDAIERLDKSSSGNPVDEAREALRPGPADKRVVSEVQQAMKTVEALSQISWRMVTFELGNAALQKTDKSVKMFIQAQ